MLFNIRHRTNYRYSSRVKLSPHLLRFQPRDDGAQRVLRHNLNISPQPLGHNEHLDLEGNRVTQIWFGETSDHLSIDVNMQIETLRSNAYNFILAPEATVLPINHEHDLLCARSYLERINPDDAVTAFAAELKASLI